jgi:hypothetical protein
MAASLAHNRHVGNLACSKRARNTSRPVPGSGCASAWRVAVTFVISAGIGTARIFEPSPSGSETAPFAR